ncbi:hypothetical protein ILYODFUR_013836 [Ilyodon furcidens]|uniref:Uncharacterized protein n=1 Tax=Ilyodon furcidens TaxID=33524 RepID=A0ABV0URS2_9TELE
MFPRARTSSASLPLRYPPLHSLLPPLTGSLSPFSLQQARPAHLSGPARTPTQTPPTAHRAGDEISRDTSRSNPDFSWKKTRPVSSKDLTYLLICRISRFSIKENTNVDP